MQYNPPRYYRPFDDALDDAAGRARSNSSTTNASTASNTTTDTEDTQVTATTGSTYSSGSRHTAGMDTGDTLDPRYQLIRAAGPQMTSDARKFEYEEGLNYSQYPFAPLPPFPPKESTSLLQKNPARRSVATLYSINSQNRDFQSYPYASYFTLQLPRTFKNVNAVNIVQISFPTISGVIPDNTNAINLQIQEQIISSVFDISANIAVNYCNPPAENELDLVTEIIDGTVDPTPYLSSNYSLCDSLATANCATGVASCLDSMYINENGRSNPARPSELLKLVYTIESGRYISDTIVEALNSSFNSTFYFENISFTDYKAEILAGRGAIQGFPYPNEYFYNNLTQRYTSLGGDVNAARTKVAEFYFPNITTMFSTPPTNQEIFVSYYYPILKEVCINPNLRFLLDYSGYNVETVYSDVVTGFFGLNYKLYVDMCTYNIDFLTQARRYYTQEYYGVNEYIWYYNPNKNRIGVTFNRLNRSIRNTISNNYDFFFSQAISFYGYSADAYTNAQAALADVNTGLPVIEPMASKFATDMGSLGVEVLNYTFNDISNNLTLYNTENTVALLPGFQILQEKAGYTNQSVGANPYYGQWPHLINLPQNYRFFQDLSAVLVIDTNYPYSVDAEQFLPTDLSGGTRNLGIDASDNVFITNGLYTDIFVNVGRTQYVIIPFRTPNKQNIQISTQSRPFKYRYPAYNLSVGGGSSGYSAIPGIGEFGGMNTTCFGGEISGSYGPYDYFNYFDDTMNQKYNTIAMVNYDKIYNIAFRTTLIEALAYPPFLVTYQTNMFAPFNYFRLTPPVPDGFNSYANSFPYVYWNAPYSTSYPYTPSLDPNFVGYTTTIPQVSFRYLATLSIVPSGSSTFGTGLVVTIYNDYALFTADLGKGIGYSEVNYKYIMEVSAGDTSGNITIPMYSHQIDVNGTAVIPKYYYIKVSQKEEVQTAQNYKLALWGETELIRLYKGFILPDLPNLSTTDFNNYTWAQVYASAKLNGVMSYWHAQVLDPDFNAAQMVNNNSPLDYQFNETIPMICPFIGHDQNGISTDLTDYRGFYLDASGYNPDAEFFADPVTGYYFKQLSDYSNISHTYFYTGSQNAVFNPNFGLYTFPTIPSTFKREFKFTHWWDTHYIGPQSDSFYTPAGAIVPDLTCIASSQLQNYSQTSVAVPGGALYGYNYYDWAAVYPQLAGQQTTIFDYTSLFTPPNYDSNRNIIGFTFTLPDGIYKMKQLTFKSAWYGAEASDPNDQIQRIFIYNAGRVNLKNSVSIYEGGIGEITGTFDASNNIFNKDLTNVTNTLILCSVNDFSPNSPTVYNINVSNPFEGQNFIIINSDINLINLEATFTDSTATVPGPLSGQPNAKYFVYKYGRWNYYSTINLGGFQYPIYSFDYNISPVAILNRKTDGTGRVSYGTGGNATNPNADKNKGTYYTFEIDTTFSNPEFLGGSLPAAEYQPNFFSSYVAVAFSLLEIPSLYGGYSFYNAAPIWLLAGSLVPHPDAQDPQGSLVSPVSPWPSTNGNISSPYTGLAQEQSMLIPNATSSPTYITGNPLESQFGQSMPISTVGILVGTVSPTANNIGWGFDPYQPPGVYHIAYQSFWPVQNIIFERVATTYKPMIELNTIVNPELLNSDGEVVDASGAFEYPRSQLFYYDNLTDLYADISDASGGYRWGFESRYKAADVSFNGYANNAYIFNLTPPTESVGYLLLRAYSPTEQYQTMVRFAIKETSKEANTRGLYTFGLKTTDMLTSEYYELSAGATNFTPDYAGALINFWNSFIGDFVFGVENKTLLGFSDLPASDTNYFLPEFINLWENLQNDIVIINNIDSYTLTQINDFINTRYGTVLPPNLLTYSALTGDTSLPVTFYGDVLGIQNSTPFVTTLNITNGITSTYSCSTVSNTCQSAGICDGIVNVVQNSFSCFPAGATIPTLEVQVGFPFATVTAIGSLEGDVNNVINQNLYLQLNQEFTFNNMDVALQEESPNQALNICPPSTMSGVPSSIRTQNSVVSTLRNSNYRSKEFRGSSKIVMGKIILNNATADVTQTLLQAPATFDPPLGKLESLSFRVLTKDLFPVYQVYPYVTPELEWNGVISISEEISNVIPSEITQVARVDVPANSLPF